MSRMPYGIDEYTTLNKETYLDSTIVQGKLETLIAEIPETMRRQLDRCFSQAFIGVFGLLAEKEENGNCGIPYFTEDAQNERVHELALRVFRPIVVYGGCLGELARVTAVGSDVKEKIVTVAKKVFRYAEQKRPLPLMDRSDLVPFRDTQTQLRNKRGCLFSYSPN